MDRSGLIELRKVFAYKEGDMAIGRFCGCFINTDKEVKGVFSERLLSKEKSIIHKFLNIYKKTLANNDVDLSFTDADKASNGIRPLLEELRRSELANNDVIDVFYGAIKKVLPDMNYVVTLVFCPYDVPVKTSDRQKIDDAGSEIFKFILCAVCPVKTAKGTLGYLPDPDAIDENPQQLIVDNPAFGFMYPSFNDRAADMDNVLCFRTDKLDISGTLFSNAAPPIEKPERKKPVKRSLEQDESNIEGVGRVQIGGGNGVSPVLSPSTSSVPSLDTGTLSNDAHYIAERTVVEEDIKVAASAGPSDSQIIASSGHRSYGGSDNTPKTRRPVKISGDASLIEKKIIDGRIYYVIAAADADIVG